MRPVIAAAFVIALLALSAAPLHAITFGEPDGNGHPNVGSIVLDIPEELPLQAEGLFQFCTGTLVPPKAPNPAVFLTASHCTAGIDAILDEFPTIEVLVTFDSEIDE